MLRASRLVLLATLGAVVLHAPAVATDNAFEVWINPSASFDLDRDTGMEIETAQRLRRASDGRADTYYARLWLNRSLGDSVTVSGAAERRINDGEDDETRFMQQISMKHGVLSTRLRLEQRFLDGTGRMGLRLRPRVGVAQPFDDQWSVYAMAEMFLTLRSPGEGGDDGLTGLRTQLGVSYALSDDLSLTAAYVRQQDFMAGGADRVAHAPLIGIEWAL